MLKQLVVALVKGLNSNPTAIIKKITDFGVSAIMEGTSGQENTFIGTYNYMPPEVVIMTWKLFVVWQTMLLSTTFLILRT